MPPQNPAPPTPDSGIKVVSGGQSHGPKKLLVMFFGLLILAIGIGAAIYIGQTQQRARSGAWDCSKYIFNVSQTGLVTVTNNSLRNEPPQKVSVVINSQPAGIFDVPELAIGDSADLGQVEVPSDGAFSWEAIGSSDCQNQGSYEAITTPTPEPTVEPSVEPTVVPSVEPTIEPTVKPTVEPTVKPSATPIPTIASTATPGPTGIPNPTPGPLNKCNGTCGSDANCEPQFICSAGRCRNPSCSDQISCACPPAWPTVAPTPVQSLPQSGASLPTILSTAGGLILLGLGILLAL